MGSKKYPSSELIGSCYQEPAPDVEAKGGVIIVDFSFPLEVLERWREKSVKLKIIDRHKTAIENLSSFSNAILDTKKHGAKLTWKTLFPDKQMPIFLEHIRDRDCWVKTSEYPWWGFSLPETSAYHEAMSNQLVLTQ